MDKSDKELWSVIDYEVQMYFETRSIFESLKSSSKDLNAKIIDNALIESMVLHTRIMVDLLISKGRGNDDIKLKDLRPEWCESNKGRLLIDRLGSVYGNADIENIPCWIFNKMLAHPTKWRTVSYDYYPALKKVGPHVLTILQEIINIEDTPMLAHYLAR
jgi:hypothetical protein